VSSARGIRAAGAFVELFADDSKLVRGLRRAENCDDSHAPQNALLAYATHSIMPRPENGPKTVPVCVKQR